MQQLQSLNSKVKIKTRKGWKSLDKDFNTWYKRECSPNWKDQKRWLSKELIKRSFIKEKQILKMWAIFDTLTDNCSYWSAQSKILSLITLCMNEELGEDLHLYIK